MTCPCAHGDLLNPGTDIYPGDGTVWTHDRGIYRYHGLITSLDLYPHEPDIRIIRSNINFRVAWHEALRRYVAYIAGCPVRRGHDMYQLLADVRNDLALAWVHLNFNVEQRTYTLRFGPFNLVTYSDRAEAIDSYQSFIDRLPLFELGSTDL